MLYLHHMNVLDCQLLYEWLDALSPVRLCAGGEDPMGAARATRTCHPLAHVLDTGAARRRASGRRRGNRARRPAPRVQTRYPLPRPFRCALI